VKNVALERCQHEQKGLFKSTIKKTHRMLEHVHSEAHKYL